MSLSTGRVFSARQHIGGVQPADALEDTTRFGNDGTFKGAGEPDWVQLPSGLWVLQFDGANDFVDLPNNTTLGTLGDSTVATWVFSDAIAANKVIYTKRFNFWGEFALNTGGTLRVTTRLIGGGGFEIIQSDVGVVTAQQWTHAVWVRTAATKTYSFFVGGEAVGGGTATDDHINGSSVARIGTRDGGGFSWNGMIGPLTVWNRVLSAQGIADLFEEERSWFGV